mmetsp:Transcript_5366/g.11781  ORF Transcript_5366/g.11781 Transcript_5366/m.11781 type:complete len:232 (-) Transcript_5366:34-729(-)
MVTTPWRPTLAMASAISLPISGLLPADTDATLARSLSSFTSVDSCFSSFTRAFTVFSMPRVSCTGLVPAATIFMPSAMKAADSTVAVVVPSPAVSLVLAAAWRTSLAPMFSTGSSSSTSLAMVTPSFTILGDPYLDSSTTLRPLGPMVTPTTVASLSAPACIFFRASMFLLKCSSLAALTTTFFLDLPLGTAAALPPLADRALNEVVCILLAEDEIVCKLQRRGASNVAIR